MGDERPGRSRTKASPVRPTRIAEITSQIIQVDLGHRHPDRRAVAGDGDGHEGFRAAWNVTGPNQTPSDRAPTTAGSPERSSPLSVLFRPMRETNRRSLPAASTRVRLRTAGTWRSRRRASSRAPLVGALRPRQLDGPAELIADAVDEILDLHRRQPGFRIEQIVQAGARVAIAEPGFAGAGDQQRHDDRREQGEKVFPNSEVRGAAGRSAHRVGSRPSGAGSAVIR